MSNLFKLGQQLALSVLIATQATISHAEQEGSMKVDAASIANTYYSAFKGEVALNDVPMSEAIVFVSPRFTLNGEGPFKAALSNLFARVKDLTISDQIHSNDTVLTFYDLNLGLPDGSIPMAERLRIENGELVEIDLIFDSARMPVPETD